MRHRHSVPLIGAALSALLVAACGGPEAAAPEHTAGNTATDVASAAPAAATAPVCADAAQTARIRKEVKDYPGDPLAIVARDLELREFTAASGFPPEMQVGALINAEQFQALWKSIDGWGADTLVRIILSPSSEHAFIVQGKVPMIKPDAEPGYLDAYADGTKGIQSHIQTRKIAAVYATDIPTDDPAYRTRGINFMDHDGNSIVGVYASVKKYDPDPKAVQGFERTRALIAKLPKTCQ